MRKKLIGLTTAICALSAICVINQKNKTNVIDGISLSNIEALSADEVPGNKIRDKYCEEFKDQVCAIYWTTGNSNTVNTTYFFNYCPREDE